jgi:hypothetical protein
MIKNEINSKETSTEVIKNNKFSGWTPLDILCLEPEDMILILCEVLDDINSKNTVEIFKNFSNEDILRWQYKLLMQIYYVVKYHFLSRDLSRMIYQIIFPSEDSSEIQIDQYFDEILDSENNLCYCYDVESYGWDVEAIYGIQ